jgi:hypothetical protein
MKMMRDGTKNAMLLVSSSALLGDSRPIFAHALVSTNVMYVRESWEKSGL